MGTVRSNQLYYITHIDNVPSILQQGILSHERVVAEGIPFKAVYDSRIVSRRSGRTTPDGRSLWSFANLYFQPRNAMLYRILAEKPAEEIAILAVKPDILNRPGTFISMGNAASPLSEILPAVAGRRALLQMRQVLNSTWWREEDGSKRRMMAECLVPDVVPPDFIHAIFVAGHSVAEKLRARLHGVRLQVIPEPNMFFQPSRKINLTGNISIVEGDMFFSRLQTLTISVNCVGVMGKGLASRAKYQFPDVYVFYQDLCRNGVLKLGQPYLYKRESSFDYQLADEPSTLTNLNLETWFLLFPTKHHWKENADISGIEAGLQWLQANYQKEGIKSLALPALGCGLGRLQWRDVGPLIVKYVKVLPIPVWIYLPAETKTPDELLTQEFLLGTE